ncbi:hypothetical protein NQ318_012937 [Aromia moschata]|uniref:RRM domain-containing protein n=1 Tax=Aromia moschata TaxID=1265417 RepID=A0AAV8X8T5_9CUCU|nr:hypothetical protein NQ318_012937 [Aromia moschata]
MRMRYDNLFVHYMPVLGVYLYRVRLRFGAQFGWVTKFDSLGIQLTNIQLLQNHKSEILRIASGASGVVLGMDVGVPLSTPRGFGFITFTDPASVDKVLAQGTHELDGKKVE